MPRLCYNNSHVKRMATVHDVLLDNAQIVSVHKIDSKRMFIMSLDLKSSKPIPEQVKYYIEYLADHCHIDVCTRGYESSQDSSAAMCRLTGQYQNVSQVFNR